MEEKFTEKVFDFIAKNNEKLLYHDQDVLNLYFANRIKQIDSKWNCNMNFVHDSSFIKNTKNCRIFNAFCYDCIICYVNYFYIG